MNTVRQITAAAAGVVLGLATALVSTAPAQAANPPGWDACARWGTGASICFFDRNPPERSPAGGVSQNDVMCIRDGFFQSNTTSYIVNHSTEAFEVFDRSDCTGNNLLIQPRSYGGVPDSWNDKISSVQRVRGIEA